MKKYLIARTYLHYAQFVLYFGKRLNVIKKSIFDIYARQLIKKGNFRFVVAGRGRKFLSKMWLGGTSNPLNSQTAKQERIIIINMTKHPG